VYQSTEGKNILVPVWYRNTKMTPATEMKKGFTGITVQINKHQPTQIKHQDNNLSSKKGSKQTKPHKQMQSTSSARHTAHTAGGVRGKVLPEKA
jgi:hypothetical protein